MIFRCGIYNRSSGATGERSLGRKLRASFAGRREADGVVSFIKTHGSRSREIHRTKHAMIIYKIILKVSVMMSHFIFPYLIFSIFGRLNFQ